MSYIEDGTGGGNRAEVTSENRLKTASLTRTGDRIVNIDSGKLWSVVFEDVDPTGADDYFLYVKNTSSSISYLITDIRIASTVAGRGQVHFVEGTAVGGTSITPVSRNSSKTPVPSFTAQNGVDITGLTNNGTLFFLWCDTANKIEHLRTTSGIILEPGGAVALLWEGATGILSGVVSIQDLSEVENG
jgi:hypothetical protein